MEVNWEQLIGFCSLIFGFFFSLRNMLVMAKDGQTKLIDIIQQLSSLFKGGKQ